MNAKSFMITVIAVTVLTIAFDWHSGLGTTIFVIAVAYLLHGLEDIAKAVQELRK